MSWRADLRQQLLHLCDRILCRGRAILNTWPGLLAVALLLFVLIIGFTFFSRASSEAAAQSPSSFGLAQLATRIPTRRPPTPTPLPTATQISASPLLTLTMALTQIVPLPVERTGPQLAPAAAITATLTTSETVAETVTTYVSPTATPTAVLNATVDLLALLVPTATPTPTRSISEALAQPVASGGLAGIVATATAAAPEIEEAPSELPAVTETDVTEAEPSPVPLPMATVASLPTPDGSARTVHVPILMYHYLSVPPANTDIYRQDLSVTPDLFAAHLDAMQQAGYTTISLYTLLDHLTLGSPLPEKPVVITFDDGYRDNYTNAFPLLRERGLTATFFIVTDFIHDQRPEYLTWDMVREMYAGGMSIEAHGRNHVSLANKGSDYLVWQALGSYESIEVEIGVRPRFISYPAGEYDQNTVDTFRSANYWAGFSTKQGSTHHSDDLFQMERIRVRGTTSPEELLRLLALEW